MADNSYRTDPGAGEQIRDKDKSGIKTQVVLIDVAGSSVEALAGDATNALPVGGYGAGGFWPERTGVRRGPVDNAARATAYIDSEGNLATRGPVTTDEQSIRDDFPGTGLTQTITGTTTLANGSTAITGSGTLFLSELDHDSYIKLSADTEASYVRIASVESDTAATLVATYAGTGGSATGALTVEFKPTTGTGGTISVANSSVTLASGTTAAALTYLSRVIDYGPMAATFAGVTMSQRIANNDMILGMQDATTSPTRFARFRATSTVNTSLIFESAYVHTGTPGANDTETTTFTLPNGGTTATAHRYRIEVLTDRVRAYIDDVLVADHATHMPDAYDVLTLIAGHINGTTPATTTSLAIDAIGINNFNKLAIAIASNSESIVATNAPMVAASGSAAANNTNLVTLDCQQYRYLVFELSGTFVGTVSFQQASDAAFTTANALTAFTIAGTAVASSATAVGVWVVPAQERYVRFRTTAYTSGTPTITVFGSQQAPPLSAIQAIQAGTWNIGTVTTVTTLTTLTNITNWGNIADNAAFTDGTTRLSPSGYIFDEVAGTALTENDAAAARIDSKRAQVLVLEDATTRGQRQAVSATGGALAELQPRTTGGLSISRTLSAATTNATSVKASAGQVYTIIATNLNAAVRYLKLYNKATAPTVGTDTPVITLAIPASTTGAGFVLDTGGMGIAFATGIALALTTGIADADTGAVAANEILVNLFYK
jgi:hypothetical protein